jgi:hypothetical protein
MTKPVLHVLYGHIHRENFHQAGKAIMYAARSLIFAFPDPAIAPENLTPAIAPEKKPLAFDKSQPFKDLGLRRINGNADGGDLQLEEIQLATESPTTLACGLRKKRASLPKPPAFAESICIAARNTPFLSANVKPVPPVESDASSLRPIQDTHGSGHFWEIFTIFKRCFESYQAAPSGFTGHYDL